MNFNRDDYGPALERIGATADGRIFRHMLIAEVQRVIGEAASDGALRAHEARRSFAAQLLRQLDPKPEPDGRTDTSLADTARSAISGARTGPRRRVPDTAE